MLCGREGGRESQRKVRSYNDYCTVKGYLGQAGHDKSRNGVSLTRTTAVQELSFVISCLLSRLHLPRAPDTKGANEV
jgi:hypothetical protein